jgi:hypothetical protein
MHFHIKKNAHPLYAYIVLDITHTLGQVMPKSYAQNRTPMRSLFPLGRAKKIEVEWSKSALEQRKTEIGDTAHGFVPISLLF